MHTDMLLASQLNIMQATLRLNERYNTLYHEKCSLMVLFSRSCGLV